jgi:outer membrane protein OmpA-like peptidoglycan-associated protein
LKKELPGFIRAYAKDGGSTSWGNPKSANLRIEVVDAKTRVLIESPKVNLVLVNKLSGLKSELTVSSGDLDLVLGYFGKDSIFNFFVKVTHPDYLPVNAEFKDLKANKAGNIDLGKIKMTQRENASRRSKYPKIRPIYFDLDKFYIRKDAAKTLDSVAKIMKQYPTVHLEIRSFTDSRASDSYNKKLSENRAKSTFRYLVKRGISPNRLIYAGYGELGLVNDCGNDKKCVEKLHQENRRSELTLID